MGDLFGNSALLFAFAGAAATTWACVPLVARLAERLGVVDRPGGRRVHARPTPRMGGVALVLGLAVGASMYALTFGLDAFVRVVWRDQLFAFLLPCMLVFTVGLIDDIRGLSPGPRIAAEAIAAAFLVQNGYVIDVVANPFGAPIELGLFAYPITIAWFVGVTNAFNLIDGLDGLLGSVSVTVLLGCAAVALLGERPASAILAMALAGATAGFLVWNWHPARIFMGDAGSLFLGFSIAALSIKVSRNQVGGTLALHVPVLLAGLPIAETLLTLARRHISAQPYFSGDRSHVHHVLLRKGLTVPRAVRSLALISALLTATAVLSRNWRETAFLVGGLVFLGLALVALRWLGYLEFRVLAGRLVRALQRPRRRDLAGAVSIAAASEAIARATTVEELTDALERAAHDSGSSVLAVFLDPVCVPRHAEPPSTPETTNVSDLVSIRSSDAAWVFGPGHTGDDRAASVTVQVPLISPTDGALLGRLVCQRPLDAGPSEYEISRYLAAALSEALPHVFGLGPVVVR